jgi:transcriptional regulator with XRE-family HTH domain
LSQREAARRANISPQTWSQYDGGSIVASPGRVRRLLDALALGERGDDEGSALLFVGYRLGGIRLLADADGAPIAFATPTQADAVCSLLDEAPLDALDLAPFIAPAWRSWGGLPDRIHELGDADGGEAATAAVVTAGAIVSLLERAPGWAVAT